MVKETVEDNRVKVSLCQKCGGWVRLLALGLAPKRDLNEMGREAAKYDLTISTWEYDEYQKKIKTMKMCGCTE